jgi:23S rRNA (cytidine2498-2'-O)-methyltransferase
MVSLLGLERGSLDLRRDIPQDVPQFLPGVVYQTAPHREADLAVELAGSGGETGDWAMGSLVYRANPPAEPVFWWRNIWQTPFVFSFSSIKKAAAVLRSLQRNWVCVPLGRYGRARLIQEALPYIAQKRRPLDYVLPDAPVGSWTLVGDHTILASASCASPFPGGIIEFEEDKHGPPSRAYLKLAEAFVRLGVRPRAGEICLDAGASPGGWTWMAVRGFPLLGLPAGKEAQTQSGFATAPRIIAVDRSPLAPSVAAISHVTFLRHDAFTLKPENIGMIDWLFCDAACYPVRLYAWIEKWLASGLCKNYICTIKMQGAGDMETVRLFAAIPGGTVVHLYHGKHELTWMMCSVV